MTTYLQDTRVTFPARQTTGSADVLDLIHVDTPAGRRPALIVAETPFHPVDHRWPDQPGDTGSIDVLGVRLTVVDCLLGSAQRGTDVVVVGSAISARRGDDEWCWLVVHVLAEIPAALAERVIGAGSVLTVEGVRRDRLSAAHTACHLSGLALNAVLAPLWRKVVSADPLGHPDFERQALVASRISEDGYHDTYRIGKSIRKSGFDVDKFLEISSGLAIDVRDRILRWTETTASVTVHTHGDGLGDVREWACELSGRPVRIACGGTHPLDLGAVAGIDVRAIVVIADGTLDIHGDVRMR